ncbi:MAG: hypothetical protein CL878_05930 [Dehalococcoidia bacterium]|nr:hypothetical protein [Dehalococcoidia bacterium]
MDEQDGDARWERLRGWLHETIEQIERGDLGRLPPEFAGEGGPVARTAYETVLIAMEVVEGKRRIPGRE